MITIKLSVLVICKLIKYENLTGKHKYQNHII